MTSIIDATDESVGRVAFRLSHFRRSDDQLQVEALAQVEEHAQIVLRQPIRLVEEQQAECSERSLGTQKVGVALPGGQNHHHERRTDPDGLARGHPHGVGDFPVLARLPANFHLWLNVLSVIE